MGVGNALRLMRNITECRPRSSKTGGRAHSPQMREAFLRIADSHERLTKLAEASLPLRFDVSEGCGSPPDDARDLRIAQKSGEETSVRHRRKEPAVQARQHVAEAEAHIATKMLPSGML